MKRFWSFLFVCGLILALFTGCAHTGFESGSSLSEESDPPDSTGRDNKLDFYYTNETFTSLASERILLNFAEGMKLDLKITQTIAALQDPAFYGIGGVSIIPPDLIENIALSVYSSTPVQVGEETEKDQDAYLLQVFLSDRYDQLPANERLVFRTGLTQSLFSLQSNLTRIHLVKAAKDENGEDTVLMLDSAVNTDRIAMNQYHETFYQDEVRVNLFFADASGNGLVREERVLSLNMTDKLPMAIMRGLINGPEEDGATATIPEGTKIRDLVIKDGVCYLDLSAEFQINHSGGEIQENLTIYSIVNSLMNVAGIEWVQLLIEGNRVSLYKNYVRLESFLSYNEAIILEP